MELKKVLLIRLDKIGDLICSLPADQILDDNYFDVTWIIQKGLGSLVDLGSKKRKYFEIDKNKPTEAAEELKKILSELKPDVAISLQCPWWVNFELFKSKIPLRAGVKSQWHSFIFLNQGLRQKRSLSEKHELEYNLELIRQTLNIKNHSEYQYFKIIKPENTDVLEKYDLKATQYVVVHPGMMGSALNWPQIEYINYIFRLIEKGHHVVVTGTDQDEVYLNEIKLALSSHVKVTWLQSKLKLNELVQVLANSKFVVAPSTGVAHIAASVGAHIKGIYSPIKVHHPKRWGPRGPNVEVFILDEKTLKLEIPCI